MKAIPLIAIAAAGVAAALVHGREPEVEPELVEVPRRNSATRMDWIPQDHVLTAADARGVRKIDAANQPCTVWLKLPPERFQVQRSTGTAGVRFVAYHEQKQATWVGFEVYRAGDFKLNVRDAGGTWVGSFQLKVSNVGRPA